jgi:hypothetical protein
MTDDWGVGYDINHIDGNNGNNKWNNLRKCSRSQSTATKNKKSKNSCSQYKGVSKTRNGKKWRSYIDYNNRLYHIGHFDTEIEAATAYDVEAYKIYGEFAKLNILTLKEVMHFKNDPSIIDTYNPPTIINGMKVRKNLIGKKFGKLLVLDLFSKNEKDNTPIWLCECDCGNKLTIKSRLLLENKTKSCGCLFRLDFGEGAFNSLFKRYKYGANERNLEFQISETEFRKLTKQNCYYCGVEPKQIIKTAGNGDYIYNGIDRLNNDIGYVYDNIVSCCGICNRDKNIMNASEFITMIDMIYNHCSMLKINRREISNG